LIPCHPSYKKILPGFIGVVVRMQHSDVAKKRNSIFINSPASIIFTDCCLQKSYHSLFVAPAKPTPPTAAEIAEASNNAGLVNALKFYELELRFEGNREWNWQLRKMNDRQLLAAGEFARRSDVLDRMVASADRAKVELDLCSVIRHRMKTSCKRRQRVLVSTRLGCTA
jgi:hypothetical protein